jgi:hypothetical protein
MEIRRTGLETAEQSDNNNTGQEQPIQSNEKSLAEELGEINPSTDQEKNNTILADLPRDKEGNSIPPDKLSLEDYDLAFMRSAFKEVGLDNATEKEIRDFQLNYQAITNDRIGLRSSLSDLQSEQKRMAENRQDGKIAVNVSDYDLTVLSAGKNQILLKRQEQEAKLNEVIAKSGEYMDDTIAGFYKVQINSLIRIADDMGKVLQLPELPKLEVKGEYWKGKNEDVEKDLSFLVDLATGGKGELRKSISVLSTAAEGTELITGKDYRTAKPMTQWEYLKAAISTAAELKSK